MISPRALLVCLPLIALGCADDGPTPGATGSTATSTAASTATSATAATATDTPMSFARFVEPTDGDSVASPFAVVMAVDSMLIEPAGEIRENSGHYHILVDVPFVEEGNVIPTDDQHLHFGTGASEVEVALPPGEHTLRLQVANGAHIAYDSAEFGDAIAVVVQ